MTETPMEQKVTDYRNALDAGRCADNRGCNVATTCMCALAEDLVEENERLREALSSRAPQAGGEALRVIERWLKPSHVRLHAGEMSAQEMRSVLAVLSAVKAEIEGGEARGRADHAAALLAEPGTRIGGPPSISLNDPRVIIAGIRQFGLACDGSDLRDLEAAFDRLAASPTPADESKEPLAMHNMRVAQHLKANAELARQFNEWTPADAPKGDK